MHSLVVSTLLLAGSTSALIAAPPAGKKVQWVGHSFHIPLVQPVAQLAKEAGISDHTTVNAEFMGASIPCQHWNRDNGKGTNTVKENLKAGKVDYLTLASREPMPDACIPNFAELAFQGNKNIKIFVQQTWIPYSANVEEDCSEWGCNQRDAATREMLEKTRTNVEMPYRERMRKQFKEINDKAGKEIIFIVPTWGASLTLREMAINGSLPGITKQSAIFRDNLGHANKPLQDMASYMFFTAMYGLNPIGAKALSGNAAQAAAIQKVAWQFMQEEPMSGLAKQ